jgi:hypothetical protein
MNIRIDVALILWNPDLIQLMSLVLLDRNLKSSGFEPSEGAERMRDLILSRSPSVVVFDLDPPYDRSATVALDLREQFPDCSMVITCADPVLAYKSAPWLTRHSVFQKPYELDDIADTVRSMVRRVPRILAMPSVRASSGAHRRQRLDIRPFCGRADR